jgi:flavodoxin
MLIKESIKTFLTFLVSVFMLALCGVGSAAGPEQALDTAGAFAGEDSAPGKTLVLYYSHTGNTKAACEALQKELSADIQEIQDLNSRESGLSMVGAMLKTILGMQTDIEPEKVDFGPYDTLIIAAPIWASKFGLAMRTFVERNCFNNKQVVIFITADSFVGEKYQEKHKELVGESGGVVIGHFQVHAMDVVDGEKVPRSKEKIVEETMKLAPAVLACLTGES